MSSATVDEYGNREREQLTRYRNPAAPITLAVVTAAIVPVALIGAIIFRVPQYFGWPATGGLVLFIFGALYVLWSFFLFLSVDVQPGKIVLRAPLRRFVVSAVDVERVELDPPLRSMSMQMPLWGRTSRLVIHRRGRHPIDASFMPDGLKLLIANALDPTSFPLPDETPRGP